MHAGVLSSLENRAHPSAAGIVNSVLQYVVFCTRCVCVWCVEDARSMRCHIVYIGIHVPVQNICRAIQPSPPPARARACLAVCVRACVTLCVCANNRVIKLLTSCVRACRCVLYVMMTPMGVPLSCIHIKVSNNIYIAR